MFTRRLSRWLGDALIYALLIGVCIYMLFPFLWMIITSLKNADEIFHIPMILIPAHPDLHAYSFILQNYPIFRVTWNTFFIAASGTALSLFFCSLGGYAFAKFKFPGQGGLFSFLIGTMVIPGAVTLVPIYLIMRDLKWIDTILPLIVPGAANAFGIFFMRQYISTISDDIMDAARIDGAGEFAIYWRIIVPMIAPGLTSLGLIFFMNG
jgi:multiple sugar transport system permease protein